MDLKLIYCPQNIMRLMRLSLLSVTERKFGLIISIYNEKLMWLVFIYNYRVLAARLKKKYL